MNQKNGSQAISKETATQVLSMMETVVQEGTGRNASVKGYRIGGKTGTSEDGVNTNKYITSFVGVAPISDPQVVMLITLYNPTGEGGHQGGGVAAPIAAQVFQEILPALEIPKDDEAQIEVKNVVNVPEIRNVSITEAVKILKDANLDVIVNAPDDVDMENTIVKEQLPKPGISVNEGIKVELYI